MKRRPTVQDFAACERFSIERPEHLIKTYGPSRYRDGSISSVFIPAKWSEITDVHARACTQDKDGGWIMPSQYSWGDYSGSTIDRSNFEVLLRDFAHLRTRKDGKPNFIEVYGSHGSHSIAISLSFLLSKRGHEVWEALCSDYCLLDDEHHSELEMRLEHEAFEAYGWDDLLRALSKRAAHDERPDLEEAFDNDDSLPWTIVLSEAIFDQTWSKSSGYSSELHEAYERNPPHAGGADSFHLPTDKWVERLSDDYVASLVTTAREMVNTWTLKGAYCCLGCRETSTQGPHGAQERLFRHGGYEGHYPNCPDGRHVPTPGLVKVSPIVHVSEDDTTHENVIRIGVAR